MIPISEFSQNQYNMLKRCANACDLTEWNVWRNENQKVKIRLEGANFYGADLQKANLKGAILREADLRGANLREADLSRADLRGADLSGSNLNFAILSKADLSGANLGDSVRKGSDGKKEFFTSASLRRANLRETFLRGTNLIKVNLNKADLSGADLIGAALFKANLNEAILEGANLELADFSDPTKQSIQLETSGSKIDPHYDFTQELTPTDSESYVYPVWYCTNRKPIYKNKQLVDFSGKRGHENQYGLCRVFVPKSHVIGSMGSPLWKQMVNIISGHERDAPLKLQSLEALSQNIYWKQIRDFFAEQTENDQSALVYIHGYNISFKEATIRAAQIGVDLSLPLTGYFSWPSQGNISNYLADEASVEASERYLTEFLTGFANKSGAKQIHLLVHSMGNRALLRSIQTIIDKIELKIPFGQIFLAAPDVDRDVFLELSTIYGDISERTTLYVSKKDQALYTSDFLHKYTRAGYLPPVTIVEGIDTVDASKIDFSFLGHGYYASARDLLKDMHDLLVNNSSPNKRFALEEVKISEGNYWKFLE